MNDTNISEKAEANWWESFYHDALIDLFLTRDDDESAATTRFLRDHLQLSAGDRVFDQCCGTGSISLPLAKTGCLVIGIDQAANYIAHANRTVDREQIDARYLSADGFEFLPEHPVDAALNWGRSFGYAADDRLNLRMLERAFESLRPGGRFVLDALNVPNLIANFQRCLVRRGTYRGTEITLLRESELDFHRGAIRQTWTWFLGDETRVEHSHLKLYMPHRLRELFEQAGFTEVVLFGEVDGSPVSTGSSRCLVLGRKPETAA